ncbi:amidase [Kineococcus sp. R8]|uniref:amidase family protein n=1 Tax=Kineococcus siccus TaxID=2696567 RepID=UPI001411F897|nr:amidase [Kineococcus siccus]
MSTATPVHRPDAGPGRATGAVAAVRASLQAIEATEGDVRAWVSVDGEGALGAAVALDRIEASARGPLHGVPFGVKDVIDLAGSATGCGSVLRRGRVAERDAWIVSRLRGLGAVPLGKTVTTEFAYFSPGPTRNPRALDRTPGGSSSGSAAAVAAGHVPLALGSQTAGSLTRPAAYCGVTGFVTPVGRVPTAGVVGLSPTLDALGVLTRTVTDLVPVLQALGLLGEVPGPARPAAVALWSGAPVAAVEPGMAAALDRAASAVVDGGGRTRPFLPESVVERATELHEVVMAFEAVRLRAAEAARPEALSDALNALFERGRRITAQQHAAALAERASLRARALAGLGTSDAVLGPAATGVAPEGTSATGSPVLSRAWQYLGLPTVTVAGLRDAAGLPLGVQLVGHPSRVGPLLQAAAWLEARLP